MQKARVLYRPKKVSQRKAPSRVARLVVPLKILMMFAAVMFFRLNTDVK